MLEQEDRDTLRKLGVCTARVLYSRNRNYIGLPVVVYYFDSSEQEVAFRFYGEIFDLRVHEHPRVWPSLLLESDYYQKHDVRDSLKRLP